MVAHQLRKSEIEFHECGSEDKMALLGQRSEIQSF
jgi:hypothetical protein